MELAAMPRHSRLSDPAVAIDDARDERLGLAVAVRMYCCPPAARVADINIGATGDVNARWYPGDIEAAAVLTCSASKPYAVFSEPWYWRSARRRRRPCCWSRSCWRQT